MSEPTQPTPPGTPEAPQPPVPPVPPAPPAPPVPQYGEYAPGYVPPAPAPEYAQYAQQVAAPPAFGAPPVPQQGARVRKTWDVVLSVVLLVLGFFGAMIGVLYGVLFTDPDLLGQALQQQGYGGFSGDAGAAPAVLIVSHLALYVLAAGITIPLLAKRRIAFWVPLTAGAIAAVIFWATLVGVLMSDPAIVSQLS